MPTIDSTLSKREILRKVEELDERRQSQINRQVDSITRLLGLQDVDEAQRVATEISALNANLADQDTVLIHVDRVLHRVGKKIHDKLNGQGTHSVERKFLSECLEILREVGVMYDDDHGSTSEGDRTDSVISPVSEDAVGEERSA